MKSYMYMSFIGPILWLLSQSKKIYQTNKKHFFYVTSITWSDINMTYCMGIDAYLFKVCVIVVTFCKEKPKNFMSFLKNSSAHVFNWW